MIPIQWSITKSFFENVWQIAKHDHEKKFKNFQNHVNWNHGNWMLSIILKITSIEKISKIGHKHCKNEIFK